MSQNYVHVNGRAFAGPSLGWISTRDAHRIDNKIRQRAVVSWEMVGSHWFRGRQFPGYTLLHLEGGGWMWFPESAPLDAAIAQAEDHGFNVTDVRARLDEWVRTGKGATFELRRP